MVFCFVQNFFFGHHESKTIYFFCRAKRNFFFQNLTLDYMTKTLNRIIFFLHQNQNIFFSNIGNQNIFLEKNHNPHPPFKLNAHSLKVTYAWGINYTEVKIGDIKRIINIGSEQQKIVQKTNDGRQSNTEETKICYSPFDQPKTGLKN